MASHSQKEGKKWRDKKSQLSREPQADGEGEEVDTSCLTTPLTAGEAQAAEGQPSQDLYCSVSFMVSPATSRAWTQLKSDHCMDDSQMVRFLLKCYEDSQHGTLCPVCQSQCQRYCPTCCTVVQGLPTSVHKSHSTHNRTKEVDLTSVHSSHNRTEEGNYTSALSHQPGTTPRPSAEESPIHGAEMANPLLKTATHPSGVQNHPEHSIISSSPQSALLRNKEDFIRKSDNSDSDTDSNCDMSPLHVSLDTSETDPELMQQENKDLASAILLDDRLKGVACISSMDAASVSVSGKEINNLSKEHGVRPDKEGGHKTVRDDTVAISRNLDNSLENMNTEENLRNKTNIDFEVKVEDVYGSDSLVTKNKKRELTKPDCVMCTWCRESFQSVRALTTHLAVHTSPAWQREHLPLTLSQQTSSNNKRKASHKPPPRNASKKCKVEPQTKNTRLTQSRTVHKEADNNNDCCDITTKQASLLTGKEECFTSYEHEDRNNVSNDSTAEHTSISTGDQECFSSSEHEDRNKEDRTGERSVRVSSGERELPYRCVQCGEGAKTAVVLVFHMQTAHASKDAYQCLHCSLTFRFLRSLARHLKTHPSQQPGGRERDRLDCSPTTHPHQCGPCGRRFMHIGGLANHMRRHQALGLGWVCSHCQSGFPSMTALTSHHCPHSNSPGGQGSSDQCPGDKQSKDTVHESLLSNKSKDAKQNVFESKTALNREQKQQEHQVLPEIPASEEPMKRKRGRKPKAKNPLTGLKEAQRPFTCSECPATFQHASLLKLHSQKHSGQKAFPCDLCLDSFRSKTEMFRHQESVHWKRMAIMCKDCGRVFTTARGLDEHRVAHTGEKPYACEECGQTFPYRGALTRHRRTHRGGYFQCGECGAEFHLKSELASHTDLKHRLEKTHLCCHCGQAFSTMLKLKRHADVHDGKKQFICELCGKAFRKRGEHKMHLLTHQEVKPHQCRLCERSFVSRCKLKLHHSLAHLGIKPFPCTQCTAAFSSATYLRDHMQLVHSSLRLFPCPLCQARFAAKRLLNLHLRRTHRKKEEVIDADRASHQSGT